MASERRKCLESGMNDYISKPYSEKTLLLSLLAFIPKKKLPVADVLLAAETPFNKETKSAASPEKSGRGTPAWLEQAVMAKIPEDLRILAEAMENQDWKALEFKAHNLISSLSILHASEGIDISRQLESASRNQDQDNSILLGKELIAFLSKLKSEEKEA
jgi:CheY-like chemotaxis protein